MSILNNYPGAKGNSGIQQFLINNIPFHLRFFELFAGTAKLFYTKKEAKASLLSDIDIRVCIEHGKEKRQKGYNVDVCHGSYDSVLHDFGLNFTRQDFIYLDPPYPESSRRGGKLYKHEMLTDEEHEYFLSKVIAIDANIMISTRENPLYSRMLKDWRKKEFHTSDRGGNCTELIYMNYPEPEILHQYDYVGHDFTDRQRIKRKRENIVKKLSSMPAVEKMSLIDEIVKHNRAAVEHFLTIDDRKLF